MKQSKTLAIAFSAAAFVLLLLTMFVPMTSESSDGASFDATLWGATIQFPSFFGMQGGTQDTSWYDSNYDDEDGITQLRMSGPFMVVGLTLAFAGAFIGLAAGDKNMGNIGVVLTVIGTAFSATALVLYEIGISAFADGANHGPGFGLAIAGICLTGLAALMFVLDD